jgi:hypothetical protein
VSAGTADPTLHMASGHSCVISEAASLQINFDIFSWIYGFLVWTTIRQCCKLGADFFLSFCSSPRTKSTKYLTSLCLRARF